MQVTNGELLVGDLGYVGVFHEYVIMLEIGHSLRPQLQ
jgi:hypothetical protein